MGGETLSTLSIVSILRSISLPYHAILREQEVACPVDHIQK